MRRLIVALCVVLAAGSIVASVNARDTTTGLKSPTAAVPLPGGGFLVTDLFGCVVKKAGADGVLSPYAGTGTCGTSGDGGPATSATLNLPVDTVPTADGGALVDTWGFGGECRVRKVAPDGTISIVAGTGTCGYSGDGGPATGADIQAVAMVPFHAPGAAVDTPGDGFLLAGGCAVRKVDGAGTISTVAGAPCPTGLALNGIACASTSLCVAGGPASGHFLADASTTPTVRSSWTYTEPGSASGNLSHLTCPSATFCLGTIGDDDVATSSNPAASPPAWSTVDTSASEPELASAFCVSAALCLVGDFDGNVRVTTTPTAGAWPTVTSLDQANHLPITAIACPSSTLCVAGGHGDLWSTGDPTSGSAWTLSDNVAAQNFTAISCPTTSLCVAGDQDGKIYVSSNPGAATPTWTGTASAVSAGAITGLSCASATLCAAVDDQGAAITSQSPTSGPWTSTHITSDVGGIKGVACPSAALCVAVAGTQRLVSVNPVAATPTWQATDALYPDLDNVPATSQPLHTVYAAVPTASGGFLVADVGKNQVREVSGGTSTVVAGTGTAGFGGDGGVATAAQLNGPSSAVPLAGGGFLIADSGNCVIRKVDGSGTISTVAGVAPDPATHCGTTAGATAVDSELSGPTAAVPFGDGRFLIGSSTADAQSDAPLPLVGADGSFGSALTPGSTGVSPTPTASPTATASSAPTASPSPTPTKAPVAAPRCTLGKISGAFKFKKPVLSVRASCTAPVSASIRASIKVTPRKKGKKKPKAKTVKIAAVSATGTSLKVTLKIPRSVVKALKKKGRAFAVVTLTATGAGGTVNGNQTVRKLSGKK